MKRSKKLLASLCTAVLVLMSISALFTGTATAASISEAWNLLKPDTTFAASGGNTYANGVTNITSAGEVQFTGLSLTADDSFIIEATINLATVGPENWHGPRIRVRHTDEQNYYTVNFYGSHMAVEGNYIHDDGSLQGYGWGPYMNTNYKRSANTTIRVKIISHPESISVYVDDVLMIDNVPVKKMNVLTGFQSTDVDTTYTATTVITKAFPATDAPKAPTGFTSILTPASEVSGSVAASFTNGVVSMNGLSELLFTNLPLTADDTFMLKTKIDLTSVGAEGWMGPRITVRRNDSDANMTQIAFLDGAVTLLGGYTLEDGTPAGFGWGPYQNWNYDRVAGTVMELTVISEPNKLIVYIDDVKVFDLDIPEKQNPYVYFYSTDANTVYTTSGLSLYKEYPKATDIPAQPAGAQNLINENVEYGTSGTNNFADGNVNITSAGAVNFYGANSYITADDTFVLKTTIDLTSYGAEGWMSPRIMIRNSDAHNFYEVALLQGNVQLLGEFTLDDGTIAGYGWGPYVSTAYAPSAGTSLELTVVSAPENIKVYIDGVKLIDVAMKKMNPLVVFQSTDDGTTYTAKDALLYNTRV